MKRAIFLEREGGKGQYVPASRQGKKKKTTLPEDLAQGVRKDLLEFQYF